MIVAAADGTGVWLIDVAFSSRAIPMRESKRWLRNQIFTACAPTWRAKDVGERHLWDHRESLVRLAGRGAVERAGLEDQRGGIQVRSASDA